MERAVSYIQSYKRKVITVENILNKRNLPAFISEDEMLCAVSAGKYYESKGKKGLVYDGNISKPGDKFLEGNVGYHVREGLHYFSREDWHRLIEFVNIHK